MRYLDPGHFRLIRDRDTSTIGSLVRVDTASQKVIALKARLQLLLMPKLKLDKAEQHCLGYMYMYWDLHRSMLSSRKMESIFTFC